MKHQDTWEFVIKERRKDIKVCVHLDLVKAPTTEVITTELIKYISLFEEIQKND